MGNSLTFSHRVPALLTATFATSALAFLVLTASTCSFVEVVLKAGEIYRFHDNEYDDEYNNNINIVQRSSSSSTSLSASDYQYPIVNVEVVQQNPIIIPAESTCIGVLIGNGQEYYEELLENDLMYKLSRICLYLSLAAGGFTCLLSWAVSTCYPPNEANWKLLGVIAAITAVLQMPIFLLFETDPCTDFQDYQYCRLSFGSFFLILSTIFWVAVTLATQCLDPPLWGIQLNAWRTEHNIKRITNTHNGTDIIATLPNNSSRNPNFHQQLQNSGNNINQQQQIQQQQQQEKNNANKSSFLNFRRWFAYDDAQNGGRYNIIHFLPLVPTRPATIPPEDYPNSPTQQDFGETDSYYARSNNSRLLLQVLPNGKRPGDDQRSVTTFGDLDSIVKLAEEGGLDGDDHTIATADGSTANALKDRRKHIVANIPLGSDVPEAAQQRQDVRPTHDGVNNNVYQPGIAQGSQLCQRNNFHPDQNVSLAVLATSQEALSQDVSGQLTTPHNGNETANLPQRNNVHQNEDDANDDDEDDEAADDDCINNDSGSESDGGTGVLPSPNESFIEFNKNSNKKKKRRIRRKKVKTGEGQANLYQQFSSSPSTTAKSPIGILTDKLRQASNTRIRGFTPSASGNNISEAKTTKKANKSKNSACQIVPGNIHVNNTTNIDNDKAKFKDGDKRLSTEEHVLLDEWNNLHRALVSETGATDRHHTVIVPDSSHNYCSSTDDDGPLLSNHIISSSAMTSFSDEDDDDCDEKKSITFPNNEQEESFDHSIDSATSESSCSALDNVFRERKKKRNRVMKNDNENIIHHNLNAKKPEDSSDSDYFTPDSEQRPTQTKRSQMTRTRSAPQLVSAASSSSETSEKDPSPVSQTQYNDEYNEDCYSPSVMDYVSSEKDSIRMSASLASSQHNNNINSNILQVGQRSLNLQQQTNVVSSAPHYSNNYPVVITPSKQKPVNYLNQSSNGPRSPFSTDYSTILNADSYINASMLSDHDINENSIIVVSPGPSDECSPEPIESLNGISSSFFGSQYTGTGESFDCMNDHAIKEKGNNNSHVPENKPPLPLPSQTQQLQNLHDSKSAQRFIEEDIASFSDGEMNNSQQKVAANDDKSPGVNGEGDAYTAMQDDISMNASARQARIRRLQSERQRQVSCKIQDSVF